jgi:hypothetical protein
MQFRKAIGADKPISYSVVTLLILLILFQVKTRKKKGDGDEMGT